MTNWYTADPHFGHDKIIGFCNRPFRSINEMDAIIQANYAGAVGPDDDFWVVGDFGFGRSASQGGHLERIFETIPGRKHLVVGNHDHDRVKALPWSSISDIATIKDGDQRLTLCHYPMITFEGARRGALQLFGHVHEQWRGTRNSINVGVDVWDFKPIRLADVIRRAKTLPVNVYWSEVEHGAELG